MFLFVGLGNYGKEYENTRHNVGFMAVDKIIEQYNFTYQTKKFHSEIYNGNINNNKCIIIKPQTYMNNSGIAVSEVSKFYKIQLKDIYVFQDDMDITIGKVKYKISGSSAGHNGIKSIDSMIGKDYNRVRIGIGRPKFDNDIINFVLNKFTKEDKTEIDNIIDKISNNIELLITNKELFINNILKK